MVREIHDWVSKRRIPHGDFVPVSGPETVTVVSPDEVDDFLGARNERERNAHLRDLRDRGLLVHNKRCLRQRVKGEKRMAFVFRGTADRVPRIRSRLLGGVIEWR